MPLNTRRIGQSLALAGLLLLALHASAQPGKSYGHHPFLWVVSHPDLPRTSHLFGTIHLPDPRVLDLPPVVLDAMEEADGVRTEIPIDQGMAQMQGLAFLSGGRTLREVLPGTTYRRLGDYLDERGVALESIETFSVWGVMSFLVLIDYRGSLNLPLDFKIYYDATIAGKDTAGLETPEEQMKAINSINEAQQIRLLDSTLEYLEGKVNPLEETVEAYLSGRDDAVEKVLELTMPIDDPELEEFFREHLIRQRDIRFAERIDTLLRANPEKGYFMAIGLAHLLDKEEGVGALLQQRGYTVERVGGEKAASPAGEKAELQTILIMAE